MSKLVSVALAAAAAVAAVATSTPVFAGGPAPEYKTAAVTYRDLNLATIEGQKQLHNRVRSAVRKICGTEVSPSPYEHKVVRNCRTAAFDSARPQIDRALAGHGPQVIVTASR